MAAPRFRTEACKVGLEGAISKRADQPHAPGDRGIWVKSKCLNREEFVVVGWTDPEGSRSHIGALLLGYYTEDGRLYYAGRAGCAPRWWWWNSPTQHGPRTTFCGSCRIWASERTSWLGR